MATTESIICDKVDGHLGDWCSTAENVIREIAKFPCKPTFDNGRLNGIRCEFDTDKVTRAVDKVVKWVSRVVTNEGTKSVREMIERVAFDNGIPSSVINIVFQTQNTSVDFGTRFRAVNDYASRNGFLSGFPNFHKADYGQGVVYGTILIKSEASIWKDINHIILFPRFFEAELGERPSSSPPPSPGRVGPRWWD